MSRMQSLTWMILLCLAAVGCGDPSALDGLPAFDSEGMEPPVARAFEAARMAVIKGSKSSDRWGELGATYHAHRLFSEASYCYQRAREFDAEEFRWAYLNAISREGEGAGPEELQRLFAEASEIRDDYPQVHIRLGAVIALRGELDAATAAYRRALETDPDSAAAHRGLGMLRFVAGEKDEALALLQRAVELAPGDGTAWGALARVLHEFHRTDLAQRALERAQSLPQTPLIADPIFESEVAARAMGSRRLVSAAVAAVRAEQFDEAEAKLQLALESRTDDPEVHYWIALVQRKTERPAEAIASLEHVLQLDSEHGAAHLGLAVLLDQQSRHPEAITHYSRAAELSPDDPSIHRQLGLALTRAEDHTAALESYRRAAALMPGDPDAHYLLAQALFAVGLQTDSIAELERTVAIAPGHRAAEALAKLRGQGG
jgi:tetratricopeptide (TPR) repeat protein